jgi:hypothetical protein
MAIHFVRDVVSNETGPRGVYWLNVTSTVAADFQFPVGKRGARILNEGSGGDEVGGILHRVGRIVCRSTKGAINDVAIIVGREFKLKKITLVRPGVGGQRDQTKGERREQH